MTEEQKTELVKSAPMNLEAMQGIEEKHSLETLDELSKGSAFLPYIKLMTGSSELCKDGTIPTNHYALFQGKKYTDLGEAITAYVVVWRPKAMQFGDDFIVSYEETCDTFKRIQEKMPVKNSGCMAGPEFLLWVPSIKKFVLFFMGSISANYEAPNMADRIKKMVRLTSHKITKAKNTWFAPSCLPCEEVPDTYPTTEDFNSTVQSFQNPVTSDVELAEEQGTSRER